MNEDHYIAATNLAKIRIARQIIGDLFMPNNTTGYRPYINALREINELHDILSKIVDSEACLPNPSDQRAVTGSDASGCSGAGDKS